MAQFADHCELFGGGITFAILGDLRKEEEAAGTQRKVHSVRPLSAILVNSPELSALI